MTINFKGNTRTCFTLIDRKDGSTTEIIEPSDKINEDVVAKIFDLLESEIKKEAKEVVEEKEQPGASDDNEAKVLNLIKKMDEGDGIYYDDLGIAISMEGIDGPMLDEILDSLTDQGLIFQPRFNHYKEA